MIAKDFLCERVEVAKCGVTDVADCSTWDTVLRLRRPGYDLKRVQEPFYTQPCSPPRLALYTVRLRQFDFLKLRLERSTAQRASLLIWPLIGLKPGIP